MKFWEAMKAMEEGNKVRSKSWCCPDSFLFQGKDSNGHSADLLIDRCIQEEWELYQEPTKTYSFMEVIKGLKEGRKFRRPYWTKDGIPSLEYSTTMHASFYIDDFEATDWIEVT